jgi:hypothetical protein
MESVASDLSRAPASIDPFGVLVLDDAPDCGAALEMVVLQLR